VVEWQQLTPAVDRSVSLRRHVTSRAMRVFGGWGYREIQIPILDYFDSLKEGLDQRQIARSFRFVDREGNLMVLQPDLTPAIAKVYAYQLQGTPLPLRLSYANKTVRVERSFAGEQLESNQLGVELIGARGLVADIEVLLVVVEVLEKLGLDDFQINVADHLTAQLLLNATGAPSRIRDEVRAAIVARDPDEVRLVLRGLGAREVYIDAMSVLAELREGLDQVERIRELLPTQVKISERLDYLKSIDRTISELGLDDHIRLDLGELGGGGYYSGLGFNVVSEGVGRELGRGGRYDELIGKFGSSTPAVGFSLSQETLVELLHSRIQASRGEPEAENTIYVDPTDPVKGLRAALERRRAGKQTEIVSRPES
jgi:ATP phosphoribosyltransferase regulatory subunit